MANKAAVRSNEQATKLWGGEREAINECRNRVLGSVVEAGVAAPSRESKILNSDGESAARLYAATRKCASEMSSVEVEVKWRIEARA